MSLSISSPSGINTFISKPSIDIEALVKTKLPPLNATVMKITTMLRDVDISTKKLADVVGFDPMLSARLLKLANSAAYLRKKQVTSLPQAIDSVGLKSLYDIVMLSALADGFSKEISNSVYGRIIWQHSVAVGLLARELAAQLSMRGAEEAFLCGLLHDIGKILLLKAETEMFEFVAGKKEESEMLKTEEMAFGLTHSEVGGYVGHKWHLPPAVCSVITHHHYPANATMSQVTTYIVNAADLIANCYGYGVRFEEQDAIDQSHAVKYLKLDREQITVAWGNIQESIKEVISTF